MDWSQDFPELFGGEVGRAVRRLEELLMRYWSFCRHLKMVSNQLSASDVVGFEHNT